MLSLEDCRRILEKNGSHYSDEEVLKIRTLLYVVAELDKELYMQMQYAPKLDTREPVTKPRKSKRRKG